MDNVAPTTTGFPGGFFAGGGIQDWYNLPAEWSLATFDTPNYLAVNGIYDLPFGKGRRWFHENSFANYLIGGWQVNGIGTVLSGTPQQVSMAANTLFNYGGTQRANWNGRNPIPNTPIKKRLNQYFNTGDFSAPGAFTYGNSPRTLGSLRAPGLVNLDLSGVKNTQLLEGLTLQFRAEASTYSIILNLDRQIQRLAITLQVRFLPRSTLQENCSSRLSCCFDWQLKQQVVKGMDSPGEKASTPFRTSWKNQFNGSTMAV